MVDATDAPDEVEPEDDSPKDPNADIRAEIEAKRQAITDVKNGHATMVAEHTAEIERKQLQAESDRLDRELATALMLADHQLNARGPLTDGEAEDDGGTLSSRRRRKPRNTSSTETTDTGAGA